MLNQKIRGLKSRISHSEKSWTSKEICFKEESSSSKAVRTAIHGVVEQDLVVVNGNERISTQTFHGKR